MQHGAPATAKALTDEKVVPSLAELRAGRDAPYSRYQLGQAYDEMFTAEGRVRSHYAALAQRIARLPTEELNRRQLACEQSFLHQGITFTVYGDNQSTERIIPTDLLPPIVPRPECSRTDHELQHPTSPLTPSLKHI